MFLMYKKDITTSKTGDMSNIMGKNPYPLSPQGALSNVE